MSGGEFQTVCATNDIPDGQGRAFLVEGRMIAVFLDQGRYSAMDDFCPHMGASLAEGCVHDGVVTCPWHAWMFTVRDGAWRSNPRTKIDVFEVRVVGDEVQVRVPPNAS